MSVDKSAEAEKAVLATIPPKPAKPLVTVMDLEAPLNGKLVPLAQV